jgi:ectoine hydroxylase-related dioxygenase (phytanoyl-CoA dioxygenase family)
MEKTMSLAASQLLRADLDSPYSLTEEQKRYFREQGYIKLKNVLSSQTIEHYRKEITAEVFHQTGQTKPMNDRTTYEKAFLQVGNIWTYNNVVKEFVFGKRLARIAAELMGTKGVRMYHDQALYKEPGGGITPWHADQYYWPLSNDNTVTAWIPLLAVTQEMGPLAFSKTSHRHKMGRDLVISDESEMKISKQLLEAGLPMDDTPFELGDVSYHYGWTFHRAGPNKSDTAREVMTIIYMDDEIRVAEPANKAQKADWDEIMPGVPVGEIPNTHLNPVLYRAE